MKQIEQAIKILKQGGVVVYPTDTAYGLAVDATNPTAVKKLYLVKGRDFNKPVHIIAPRKNVELYVKINPPAKKLIKKFWPGALTIVLSLKAKGLAWQKLSAKTKTMGIRYPDNSIALDLVEKFGNPITTTSANVSGQANCYSVQQVKKQFTKVKIKPDFYIDGGKLTKTAPSTVVSLIKGVKILRAGPISETQIKNALK